MGSQPAIGVDVVHVDRFSSALARWPGLLRRVFTDAEIQTAGGSDERLAARFAAKEATFKALGDGWPRVGYRDVEVLIDGRGAPSLSLIGRAATLARDRAFAVSMSHDEGIAMAGVVACPTEEG